MNKESIVLFIEEHQGVIFQVSNRRGSCVVLDIVKVYLKPSAFLSFATKLDLKSLLCLISFKDIII